MVPIQLKDGNNEKVQEEHINDLSLTTKRTITFRPTKIRETIVMLFSFHLP